MSIDPIVGDIPLSKLERFVEACHRVAGQGLVRCSSGNLSWRLGEGLVAITASGSWLERITTDEVAICRLSDGGCINGKKRSVESRLHLEALRAREDVAVVLHCQSPYATAIGCGDVDGLDFNVIAEVGLYIGEPGVVPYLTPGTSELAVAVGESMATHDLVVMKNHGQAVVGGDFDEAIQRACFFELACQILLCGRGVQGLSRESVEDLSRYRDSKLELGGDGG